MAKGRSISALAPWFGSNRTLAKNVGAALDGCAWVGVPFAGGMSELRHISARTVQVGDLHRHVVNLATVAADPVLNSALRQRLADLPFHPDLLAAAQLSCRQREEGTYTGRDAPLWWACDYFVCAWMSRNGTAGTEDEFDAGFSVRWEGGGGDSALRFRHATEALAEWQAVMRRCNFVVMDVFEFLDRVKDEAGIGLYLDPPFPGPGDDYKHCFTEEQHRRLANRLAEFGQCRAVARFYDHPLVRELYPQPAWQWNHFEGRKQTNAVGPEVLLVRGGAA